VGKNSVRIQFLFIYIYLQQNCQITMVSKLCDLDICVWEKIVRTQFLFIYICLWQNIFVGKNSENSSYLFIFVCGRIYLWEKIVRTIVICLYLFAAELSDYNGMKIILNVGKTRVRTQFLFIYICLQQNCGITMV
jgi:hypothetical protein